MIYVSTEKYPFKRSFYYDVRKAIENKSINFILGTRKCGKTVCMHQLKDALSDSVYIDMKADYNTDAQRLDTVNQILKSIATNQKVIYLIDEATYMAVPDKDIARIAGAYSEYNNQNTKIVFSGSQSKALDFWGHIACGGNANFIKTGFLSYPEWLAFKGLTEVSEKTYIDFLCNSKDFYKEFSNTKEYLQGCLDETVISNRKPVEYIMGNDVENLTVEMLLDVLYASLVKLHNHTNYHSFTNKMLLETMLAYHFGEALTKEEINRIDEIIGKRYNNFKTMNSYDCKTAMQFLRNCGLTTLTYVSDELTADPYISDKLLRDSNELHTKPQVFSRFNLTINYPMFYVDLVKNVLNRVENELPKELLGSIVECHVRSLLPTTGSFEYRSNTGIEIDYVSNEGYGIEISVANKRMRDVNLNSLPKEYKKILLTKDVAGEKNGIQLIPYYQFIYEHSIGKELLNCSYEQNRHCRNKDYLGLD